MSTRLLWLALAAPLGTLCAQTSQEPASLEIITVEASKLPLLGVQAASRISIIDGERMEQELAQTINDLVRYEPGVDVVDQGSRFGFSGFSIRGTGGNRVLIEVDGVPAASAFSIGSFSNASRDLVDIASVRQVEITRGPASALFGSDALGGVVSFVTRSPADYLADDATYFDVSAGYNDVDSSFVTSATAAGALDNWSAMLRVTARDGEGRDIPVADPLEYDSLNLLAKLAWGRVGAGGLELTVEDMTNNSETQVESLQRVQDFTAAFGFPYVINTTNVDADDKRTRTRYSLAQEWAGGLGPLSYLRWRVYQQDSLTSQVTGEDRESLIAGRASAVSRQRTFRFDQDVTGIEVNSGYTFATGSVEHLLAFGLEYEQSDTAQIRDGIETDLLTGTSSSQVGPDLFPVRDFPLSETRRTGLYLQDQINLGRLSIIPGLRWDRYELEGINDAIFSADNPTINPTTLDENQVSPKLGITYDISDAWQLYGQYAEGFRAPPVNDVNVGFTNFQFGYTTIPNPDLEAESSESVELGARFASDRVSADLALFSTDFDDFIQSFQVVDFDPINQLLVFQSINVDAVKIEGAEFSGSLLASFLPEGFQLNLSAAYARGEDRQTGLPINSVAPLNATFGVDYAAPGGRWGMSLVTRAAANQNRLDESGGPLLRPDGYVIYDTFGYFKPTASSRVRAGIYNLSDHDYTAYLDVQGVPTSAGNPERFQRPGRHFSVAFDWTF
ncbi:MAG: TonB-dependent hemoglobin/transferrin/lactoferrin family receptor [Lysobacterales bacterium]